MSVRTAVIGGGAMGKGHLNALGRVANAEVVALVDPDPSTLESVAAEHGVPAAYGDYQAMLQAEKPEYVVVASPALYHAEHSIAAFEAGANVLCEKPLCMNLAEAEAIVEAGKKSGNLFTMGFQMRQNRFYRALRNFIAAGKLGEVYHTRVWGGHLMAYPWGRFHHRREYSFGGVLGATVIHILDAALWVLGMPEPVTVSASTNCRIGKMPDPPIHFEGQISEVNVEDFGHAHVRFADGSSMSIEGSWLTHPGNRVTGFEVNGTLGVAKDSGPVELEERAKIVPTELDLEPETKNQYAAAHEEFIKAIQENGEPLVSYRDALIVFRLLVGIYESAEQGREVDLG